MLMMMREMSRDDGEDAADGGEPDFGVTLLGRPFTAETLMQAARETLEP